MQPTTLNKIVSLFLVGGLAMIGAVALFLRHVGTIELPHGLRDLAEAGGEGFLAVISGLLLLPIASVAGAVCEGLTAPTIRRLIRWVAKKEYLVKFLCQGKVLEAHNFWKDQFRKSIREVGALRDFPEFDSDHGLAVGILYHKGQEQAITWTESHYSTYVLASNFAFLALLAQCYLVASGIFGWMHWQGAGWASLGVVAVLYSSLSLSLDCYLFSYQFALRQVTVSLLIETRAEQEPDTYNTVAAPDANRASHGRRR
jgi:hypothetical protein